MSRLFYNTINRCDIGGFQVASFLFINEWPKYFWRNYYYLSNFILFDGLRKGWLNANNIKIIIYILIEHVFQQVSVLFSRSLSINFFLIDTISLCQHKSRNGTPDINKNNTMHIMHIFFFLFCCMYYFLWMFLCGLCSLKVILLIFFSHINLSILPRIIPTQISDLTL